MRCLGRPFSYTRGTSSATDETSSASNTMGMIRVDGPRPSAARTVGAQRLVAEPVPGAFVGEHEAEAARRAPSCRADRRRRRSTPSPPAPRCRRRRARRPASAMAASLTTRTFSRCPSRRRIPRMTASSWGRSTPAMPSPTAEIVRPCGQALHDVVEDLLDLELAVRSGGWRRVPAHLGQRPVPLSSASRPTVLVPPASMPRRSVASVGIECAACDAAACSRPARR